MSDGFNIDTSGIDILTSKLSVFTPAEVKKIVTEGLKDAAAPIVVDIKKRAPRDKGELGNSVKAIVAKDRDFGFAVIIRPHLKGSTKKKAYYAKFLEMGTEDRRPKKNGKAMYSSASFVGRYFKKAKGIKAKPFVMPAYDANKNKVAEAVAESVSNRINKMLDE